MAAILDKKFTKIWQAMKKNAGIKSSPWFKKADAAVSKKVEAYQKAVEKAKSGLTSDLLKLGKALADLEEAFTKFVDAKGLGLISDDDVKKTEKTAFVNEITKYKLEVQHERATFDSRLKSTLAAADNDIKKLESLDAVRKKEIWKGFGVDL